MALRAVPFLFVGNDLDVGMVGCPSNGGVLSVESMSALSGGISSEVLPPSIQFNWLGSNKRVCKYNGDDLQYMWRGVQACGWSVRMGHGDHISVDCSSYQMPQSGSLCALV